MQIELLEDLPKGSFSYDVETGGVDVVDPSIINLEDNTVKIRNINCFIGDVDNIKSIYERKNGFTIHYSGTRITASDQISVIKSSVFVKYIDENGKEISKMKTLIDNKNYATGYSDSGEISIEGYEFVGLGDKSSPKEGKVSNIPQTIVYRYKKKSSEKKVELDAPNTGVQGVGIALVVTCVTFSILGIRAVKRKI